MPTRKTAEGIAKRLQTLPSDSTGGWHIRGAARQNIRPYFVETKPGAVAFYEKVRPILEAAYDAVGIGPNQALDLDQRWYFRCLKRGPGAATLESFLDTLDATGAEQALFHLESCVDENGEIGDAHPLWNDLSSDEITKALESWGPPAERDAIPVDPARAVRHVKDAGTPARHYRDPMECDICGRAASPLAQVYEGEQCYRCFTMKQILNESKGREVRYWTEIERRYV